MVLLNEQLRQQKIQTVSRRAHSRTEVRPRIVNDESPELTIEEIQAAFHKLSQLLRETAPPCKCSNCDHE